MLAIDGALIGFSGHLVRFIPVVRGWKTENETKVEDSVENFRTGMAILDEDGTLEPGETGYEETARLLVDRYDVGLDEDDPSPIELQSRGEGAIELETSRKVALEGDTITVPTGPSNFELPFAKLRGDGERYAIAKKEEVDNERENRRSHFNILGGFILIVGTLLLLLGTIFTGADFIQSLLKRI